MAGPYPCRHRPMFPVASLPMATTSTGRTLVSDDLETRAIAWRRHLHANPELSFEEHETAAFVEQTLRSFGGLEIERPAGTAVVARLHGARPGQGGRASRRHGRAPDPRGERRPVCVDATRRDARLRPRRPHGDAARRRADPRRTARRARRRGAVRVPARRGAAARRGARARRGRRRRRCRPVAGVHLLSALETGSVSSRAGAVMAAADLFTLEIVGRGGHGANPHETVDPVAVAAQVITNLQQIVARETDPFDSVVVSVTTLDAGTARNVIPGSARLGGTVRTLSPARRAGGARRDGACHRRRHRRASCDLPVRLRGRLRPRRQRRRGFRSRARGDRRRARARRRSSSSRP